MPSTAAYVPPVGVPLQAGDIVRAAAEAPGNPGVLSQVDLAIYGVPYAPMTSAA